MKSCNAAWGLEQSRAVSFHEPCGVSGFLSHSYLILEESACFSLGKKKNICVVAADTPSAALVTLSSQVGATLAFNLVGRANNEPHIFILQSIVLSWYRFK